MRGEHLAQAMLGLQAQGSSPHARGALVLKQSMQAQCRIIPACAGSTYTLALSATHYRDHPRMRGEHTSRPARLVNILA